MTAQLAIMTQAGVDLTSALGSLVRQCKQTPLRDILGHVHESVLEGNSISESLRNYNHVFNDAYIASVAAGEASGRLPEVLKQLAELLRGEVKLRASIGAMLAYPIILMSVSSVVLFALVLLYCRDSPGVLLILKQLCHSSRRS